MSTTRVKILNKGIVFNWKSIEYRTPIILTIDDNELIEFIDRLEMENIDYEINPSTTPPPLPDTCQKNVHVYRFSILNKGVIFSFENITYRTPTHILIDEEDKYKEFKLFLDTMGIDYVLSEYDEVRTISTYDPVNDCGGIEARWNVVEGSYDSMTGRYSPNGDGFLQLTPKSWANNYYPCGVNIIGENIDSISLYQNSPGSDYNPLIGNSKYTGYDTIPLSFKLSRNGNPTCMIGHLDIYFTDPSGYVRDQDINFVENIGDFSKYSQTNMNMDAIESDGIYAITIPLNLINSGHIPYNLNTSFDYPRAFSFDISNNSNVINYFIFDSDENGNPNHGYPPDSFINMGFNIPSNVIKTTGIYETDYKIPMLSFFSNDPFTLNSLTTFYSDCYKNYPEYDDDQNLDSVPFYFATDIDTSGEYGDSLYKMYENGCPVKYYQPGIGTIKEIVSDTNGTVYVLEDVNIHVYDPSDLSLQKIINKGIPFDHMAVDIFGNLILSQENTLYSLNISTENYNWTYNDSNYPINTNILNLSVDSDGNIYLVTANNGDGETIYKIDKNGNGVWTYNDGSMNYGKIDWDVNRNVYVLKGSDISKFDSTGNETDFPNIAQGGYSLTSIAAFDYIFAGDENGSVYKLDSNGNVLGTYNAENYIQGINVFPDNNELILLDNQGKIYNINYVDMTLNWKQTSNNFGVSSDFKKIRQPLKQT